MAKEKSEKEARKSETIEQRTERFAKKNAERSK